MSNITFQIATSIKYGQYKSWRQVIEYRRDLFFNNIKMLRKQFIIPENLVINCRPIQARRNMLGAAWKMLEFADIYVIDIEARQTREDFFSTLFHEMVHIEQFYKEKLCITDNECGTYTWKGKEYARLKTTDDKYDDLPWEKEANRKAARVLEKFSMELNFDNFIEQIPN